MTASLFCNTVNGYVREKFLFIITYPIDPKWCQIGENVDGLLCSRHTYIWSWNFRNQGLVVRFTNRLAVSVVSVTVPLRFCITPPIATNKSLSVMENSTYMLAKAYRGEVAVLRIIRKNFNNELNAG